jgi:hypothetical protein
VNWKAVLAKVPAWHERPSGLLVPTNVDGPAVRASDDGLPPGVDVPRPDLFVLGRVPSSFEQFRTYPDERGLDYSISTPEDLDDAVGHLTFETGMVALARLAAHVEHMRGGTREQLSLADAVFGDDDLVARLTRFAEAVNFELEVFPAQHISALQRLLVLKGADRVLGEESDGEQAIFNRIFFAMASFSDESGLDALEEEGSRGRWLAYLIQNGTYNGRDAPMESMTRPQTLFTETAADLLDHPDFCPVGEWFVEDYKLSISEQYALGFAVLATAKLMEASLALHERAVLGPDFFPDLTSRLGQDPDDVTEVITAGRSWYAEGFGAGEQTKARPAWERTPFDIRPVLRLAGGAFVVVSPWAISSWIGDGFFHRALASARRRGQAERLLRFYGALIERYALHTLQQVHPEPRPLGSGRVFGDRAYGPGDGKRTPDICVDCGPDLILIEVTSGRFTLPTLIEGDPDKAAEDLARLLFNKLDQLGRRIDDLLAGEWSPPDVELEQVERIWPVVVTADMLQNDLLWQEIKSRLPEGLRRARVQQLTLLDLPDVELIGALVEQGFGLSDLLARKAGSPYAEMDLRRFVYDSPDLPHKIRLSTVEERWIQTMVRITELLGFDADEETIRRHADESPTADPDALPTGPSHAASQGRQDDAV